MFTEATTQECFFFLHCSEIVQISYVVRLNISLEHSGRALGRLRRIVCEKGIASKQILRKLLITVASVQKKFFLHVSMGIPAFFRARILPKRNSENLSPDRLV